MSGATIHGNSTINALFLPYVLSYYPIFESKQRWWQNEHPVERTVCLRTMHFHIETPSGCCVLLIIRQIQCVFCDALGESRVFRFTYACWYCGLPGRCPGDGSTIQCVDCSCSWFPVRLICLVRVILRSKCGLGLIPGGYTHDYMSERYFHVLQEPFDVGLTFAFGFVHNLCQFTERRMYIVADVVWNVS